MASSVLRSISTRSKINTMFDGKCNQFVGVLFARSMSIGGENTQISDEDLRKKRARLLYQSTKRGILECDILLGGFCRAHVNQLTPKQLDIYDRLVNGGHNEWDIYYWIVGTKPTPEPMETEVMGMLRKYALETKKHYEYKTEKM